MLLFLCFFIYIVISHFSWKIVSVNIFKEYRSFLLKCKTIIRWIKLKYNQDSVFNTTMPSLPSYPFTTMKKVIIAVVESPLVALLVLLSQLSHVYTPFATTSPGIQPVIGFSLRCSSFVPASSFTSEVSLAFTSTML